MSFSKAKLHRFNDEKRCAPPPGAYNPGKVDKSVGPIIHKTERFSENYKPLTTASSTDSVNSIASERGTSSTVCGTFKTPRIPNTPRGISRTEIKRKGNLSPSKAASADCINKKSSHYDHEMNPLKYSLHMLQDELAIEKNKNEQLSAEFNQLRITTSEAECFSEWLVDIISQKNEFIDLLTEKCRALGEVSVKSFESYRNSAEMMSWVLEAHHALSCKTELDLTNLVRCYEELVTTHNQDLESLYCFLVDLQQKQNNVAFDKAFLDDSLEQCNLLLETLKETERGRKRYEMIISEMQKVIDVLKGRVHESDEEVRRISNVMNTMNQEKAKLCSVIQSKEEEITRMRTVIDAVRTKFFHEVHSTENNLFSLVDDFKEQGDIQKRRYEEDIKRKDLIISELTETKNAIDLQLQESLDEIEILKLKEENFQKCSKDLRDRCAKFEEAYKECCEKLLDLERTYEEGAIHAKFKTEKRYSKSGFNVQSVRKIVDSLVQNNVLGNDVTNRFDNIENLEESMSILQELLMNNFACKSNDKTEFLQNFMKALSASFFKFVEDICALKNDFNRLHDDFIEKCDECGQLTRLLQLSEKNLENSEKKTEELTIRLNEWETELKEQRTKISDLELDNFNLKQQLIFEADERELYSIAKTACTDQKTELETSLKKESEKNEELVKRIAKLEDLIGPYRSVLEKFKNEKKFTKMTNAKLVEQNTKFLGQRCKELKSFSSAPEQPKKGNARKTGFVKEGKENHIIRKNNETFEVKKTAPVEIPMNATYVVTSPKVSRI